MKENYPIIENHIRHRTKYRWRIFDWLPRLVSVSTKAVAKAMNLTEAQAYSQLYNLAKNPGLVVRSNGGWKKVSKA